MSQRYFNFKNSKLEIRNVESVRNGFYLFAGILTISVFFFVAIAMGVNISEKRSVIPIVKELFSSPILVLIGIILPVGSLILASRFPPAPKVEFDSHGQTVSWNGGKNHLTVPFNLIHFATSRLLSKSGISTVMVAIFAIDNKPFFKGEVPSADPEARYRKDLCVYKAGTQEDADESIEIIKSFMAGTYDESSSKFDDL